MKHPAFSFAVLAVLLLIASALPCSAAVYVKWDSPGPTFDGDSWATAYHTVQAGIDDADIANEEVWVSGDSSHPYVENIVLRDGVGLYGGFAGTETARDQRNSATNVTILDGNQANSVVRVVAGAGLSTVIDGFTVRNGNATYGGGIYCSSASTTISNNTVTGNASGWMGAGIWCAQSSSAVITLNTITANNSANHGGGIGCDASSPTISNNTITSNTANGSVWGNGGGIICVNVSSPTISGNTISGNNANGQPDGSGCGGGIMCDSGSCPTISGNTIQGNHSRTHGGGISCWHNAAAVITGNTITENDSSGGDYCVAGGIHCDESSATISGNVVSNNTATNDGGGILCINCSPTIQSNTISANSSTTGGGVICNWSAGSITQNVITGNNALCGAGIMLNFSSPSMLSNHITGNISSGNGGGIDCNESSAPLIANNIIADNQGNTWGGGGIICDHSSSPTIINNTLVGNTGSWGGGIACANASSPTISSNVVTFGDYGIGASEDSHPALSNNCVYGNSADNYSGLSPGPGDISQDPLFVDRATGDYHVTPDSPCIDAGTNNGAPATDYQGRVRPQDGDGDGTFVCDIGAYEYRVVYVKWDSPGPTLDGKSWATAYHIVQEGLNSAISPDEVWVAAGTYVENITLKNGVGLYGGFAGTETSRDQRNWNTNVTILDGNQAGSVVTSPSGATATTVIDGFTIRNGIASGGGGIWGGGIYCYSSSPTITNNTITANNGGGIYCDLYSSSTISNNTIAGNSGGGISCNSSSPAISNNVITGNSFCVSGGGIDCAYSSPAISNNTITANSASSYGGGIYCYSSSPTITNNTITGNSAATGGGIFCWDSSSSAISNNVVAFNSNGICNSSGSPTLRNNDVYGNTAYNYSGLSPGTGDISADPLFVNRTGGDYHITSGSPCVNTGDNWAPGLPATDMDGDPRIFWGTVDIGADEFCPPIVNIAQAKAFANDTPQVYAPGVVVSAAFPQFFYIEADDRSSGIRVEKTGHGLTVGMRADVFGVVKTIATSGERCIAADFAVQSAPPGNTGSVKPLVIGNRAVGGGDWYYNPSTGAGQMGVKGNVNLNNIGLLVTTTGRVTYNPTGSYFVVSDGSSVIDQSGYPGVRVTIPYGIAKPEVEKYVIVTGISSIFKSGADYYPLIRVRTQADIVVFN